jgi:hypothetical protein
MTAHATPPPSPHETLNDLAATARDLAGRVDTAATRHRGDGDGDGLDAAATILAAIDRLTSAVITVLQASGHHDVIAERHHA